MRTLIPVQTPLMNPAAVESKKVSFSLNLQHSPWLLPLLQSLFAAQLSLFSLCSTWKSFAQWRLGMNGHWVAMIIAARCISLCVIFHQLSALLISSSTSHTVIMPSSAMFLVVICAAFCTKSVMPKPPNLSICLWMTSMVSWVVIFPHVAPG